MKITRHTSFENLPDILLANEVAAYLDLSAETVRDYMRRGLIRASKQGRHYRVRKEWLMDYLDESARSSTK